MRARKGTRGQFLNAGRGLYSDVSLSLPRLPSLSLPLPLPFYFLLSVPSLVLPSYFPLLLQPPE